MNHNQCINQCARTPGKTMQETQRCMQNCVVNRNISGKGGVSAGDQSHTSSYPTGGNNKSGGGNYVSGNYMYDDNKKIVYFHKSNNTWVPDSNKTYQHYGQPNELDQSVWNDCD